MAHIALFHPSFGVTPGVEDAAARLRAAGHDVTVVVQYDEVFDDYDKAGAFVESFGGYPQLMRTAVAGVEDLPDGFVVMGFSNGAGCAEYVATQRSVSGAVLIAGALALELLGVPSWPAATPVQLHATTGDPRREQDWVDSFSASVEASGAPIEVFDYPGDGHLFTDPSLESEYQQHDAEQLWERVLAFGPLQDD